MTMCRNLRSDKEERENTMGCHLREILLCSAMLAATVCRADGSAETVSRPIPTGIDLRKVRIIGKTNRSALSYREKEEMVFTFRADFGKFSPKGYFLSYVRQGDDGREFSGRIEADRPLVVRTSLDKPGFVSVTATLTDADGKAQKVAFYAGAAVKPEQLEACEEPQDFDAFWAKQLARLDAVPFIGKVLEQLVWQNKELRVYAVSIPCVGRPATGYLVVPANARMKSLPAEIVFDGYGAFKQQIPKSGSTKKIVLRLNAHGQELGKDAAYYKKFFQSINSRGYGYAKDPEQNRDPETAYFNGMIFRALRGVAYLKNRPEWDGKNLEACGTSQGGLQTVWVTALDPAVSRAWVQVPWCCDLAGNAKKGRFTGSSLKYVPALDYYDPVFMAKRIRHARVVIHRAGLGDSICPPSGLAVFYKNLATPVKSIRWVQGSDHSFVPGDSEVVVWKTY